MQEELTQPICFLAQNGDTLHYGQGMKADDRSKFQAAIQQEFDAYQDNRYWDIIQRDQVPEGEDILDLLLTGDVYKHKARLNLHGGHQKFAINFYETYSPVVSWFTCRILLLHSLIFRWHTRQIDFVFTYPQADIEQPLYMKLPHGIIVKNKHKKTHVLKLRKNLYGQRQAGRVWFKHQS